MPDFSRSPFRKVHVAPPEQLRAAWDLLSWQARGLHRLLLTEANRDGFLDLGTVGLMAVCAFIRAARSDWPGIEPGLRELIDGGWLIHDPEAATLTIAWYQLSQKTPTAEAIRKQAYRDKTGTVPPVSHGCPNVPAHEDDSPSDVPMSQPERTRIENRDKRIENTTKEIDHIPQNPSGNTNWKPKGEHGHLAQALAELFKRAPALKPSKTYPPNKLGGMLNTGLPQALETKLAHAWGECSKSDPPTSWDAFLLLADYFKAGHLGWLTDPLPWIIGHLAEAIEQAEKWEKAGRSVFVARAAAGRMSGSGAHLDAVRPDQPTVGSPLPPEPERELDRLMRENKEALARGEKPQDFSPPPGFFEQVRKSMERKP